MSRSLLACSIVLAALLFVRDIACDVEPLAAGLDDEPDRLLGTHRVDVGTHHSSTSTGELHREGTANSAARSRYDRVGAAAQARRSVPPQDIHHY